MPRLLAPVPRPDPVRVDIGLLPRTDSELLTVGRDDTESPALTGSVRASPVATAPTATAAGSGSGSGVAAEAAGAMPHTSQNPSSMLPVQPGR
jgi:hypothetical protein